MTVLAPVKASATIALIVREIYTGLKSSRRMSVRSLDDLQCGLFCSVYAVPSRSAMTKD
jgi:hypothetical protein